MGCCGRGATQKSKNQAFAKALVAGVEIAANGFVEVEYVGLRSPGESFTVYGFFTGTMYRVKPAKTFMVDSQDLVSGNTRKPGILEMLEVNKEMFRLVKPQEEKVQTLVKEPTGDDSVNVMVETVEPDDGDVVDLFTPLDGNLSALDFALKNSEHNRAALEAMWAYEMANQNRKGAFNRIEEAIDNLEDDE